MVLGIIGISLTVYINFFKPGKSLEIKVNSITNLLDIKDNNIGLKVFIRDSIQIDQQELNISIYQIEVKNSGDENIKVNDFDSDIDLGFSIKSGEILNDPVVVNSSDYEYFSNAIKTSSADKIVFNKKIFDSNNYFQVKFFVLHQKNEIPMIKSFGRISGQGAIPVIFNASTTLEKQKDKERTSKLVLISFFFTLLGFIGLIYAYLKSIKNQKLIAEQKYIIENLTSEGENSDEN